MEPAARCTPDPEPAVAERFADWAARLAPEQVPAALRATLEAMVAEVIGLAVAARERDYLRAVLAAWDGRGDCTAFGHETTLDPAGAALVNGTAAHGEDYDDTFEGTPVHAGAVVVPAVLAACEGYGRSGGDALRGLAVGAELTCRLALVAPTAIHRAGFHPTAVIGALGAAAGVAASLGLDPPRLTAALGIAGSFASGILEYLAEGTWTKRLHPGWAAQAGLRAARLGQEGFLGPRSVLEGQHGFFMAFAAEGAPADFAQVTAGLGARWRAQTIAFKPYACGTMAQPFIDCAIALRQQGLDLDSIEEIVCKVGEGTVHRLWEPRAEKVAPSTPYSAKFSVPFCIAVALADGAAGLEQFTESRIADPSLRRLAGKVRYEIDPDNDYPANYSGDLRLRLSDGATRAARQPHLRGGKHAPLGRDELGAKLAANLAFGGWPAPRATEVEGFAAQLFDSPDLRALRGFRC